MRSENQQMKKYLQENGIEAIPKYIYEGSLRGCWRLYNSNIKWYGNKELHQKLTALGFKNYNNEDFDDFDGNGGAFSVFVRNEALNHFLKETNK